MHLLVYNRDYSGFAHTEEIGRLSIAIDNKKIATVQFILKPNTLNNLKSVVGNIDNLHIQLYTEQSYNDEHRVFYGFINSVIYDTTANVYAITAIDVKAMLYKLPFFAKSWIYSTNNTKQYATGYRVAKVKYVYDSQKWPNVESILRDIIVQGAGKENIPSFPDYNNDTYPKMQDVLPEALINHWLAAIENNTLFNNELSIFYSITPDYYYVESSTVGDMIDYYIATYYPAIAWRFNPQTLLFDFDNQYPRENNTNATIIDCNQKQVSINRIEPQNEACYTRIVVQGQFAEKKTSATSNTIGGYVFGMPIPNAVHRMRSGVSERYHWSYDYIEITTVEETGVNDQNHKIQVSYGYWRAGRSGTNPRPFVPYADSALMYYTDKVSIFDTGYNNSEKSAYSTINNKNTLVITDETIGKGVYKPKDTIEDASADSGTIVDKEQDMINIAQNQLNTSSYVQYICNLTIKDDYRNYSVMKPIKIVNHQIPHINVSIDSSIYQLTYSYDTGLTQIQLGDAEYNRLSEYKIKQANNERLLKENAKLIKPSVQSERIQSSISD